MNIFITGGCGFIGTNFINFILKDTKASIINLDKLTYAANQKYTKDTPQYKFIEGDIADKELVTAIYDKYLPSIIINFAAESHVDRSIEDSSAFIGTNILGTHNLLECSDKYFNDQAGQGNKDFKFIHISTDEVYGSLELNESPFKESNKYYPNSPYSASKASSDHLVRAWNKTYGLPTILSNCSNNYGPFQNSEKFIPMIIKNALTGKDIGIYGDGQQIRDWLFVGDHCAAIKLIYEKGSVGEIYNIGGDSEKTNLEVVKAICNLLDRTRPNGENKPYFDQVSFIDDRAGHDRRYAIDHSKITNELGWLPNESFESGIKKTVEWYLGDLN